MIHLNLLSYDTYVFSLINDLKQFLSHELKKLKINKVEISNPYFIYFQFVIFKYKLNFFSLTTIYIVRIKNMSSKIIFNKMKLY